MIQVASKTAIAVCSVSNSKTNKRFKPGETLVGFTAEKVEKLVKMKAARYASDTTAKAD